MLGGALEDRDDLVVDERLLDVVVRARVHRLDGRAQVGLRGHEDDGDVGVARARRGEHVESTDARHADIGEDDVGVGRLQLLQPLLSSLRDDGIEALVLEEDAKGVEDPHLIVDDEDARLLDGQTHAAFSFSSCQLGSRMVKRVP